MKHRYTITALLFPLQENFDGMFISSEHSCSLPQNLI